MFVLSEEQQLIQDSARKLLDADYEFEQRKQRLAASPTFDADVWRQFAELGWLGIALPEDDGGFGGKEDVRMSEENRAQEEDATC